MAVVSLLLTQIGTATLTVGRHSNQPRRTWLQEEVSDGRDVGERVQHDGHEVRVLEVVHAHKAGQVVDAVHVTGQGGVLRVRGGLERWGRSEIGVQSVREVRGG